MLSLSLGQDGIGHSIKTEDVYVIGYEASIALCSFIKPSENYNELIKNDRRVGHPRLKLFVDLLAHTRALNKESWVDLKPFLQEGIKDPYVTHRLGWLVILRVLLTRLRATTTLALTLLLIVSLIFGLID